MAELAVTAIGADRPGIIARVTEVLYDHGGNLLDSSMTILAGHFAIMLPVETDAAPETLERDLSERTADLGLVVSVRPVGAGAQTAPATHVVSVYGSDRPGIVHEVAEVLFAKGVNVTDLTTRVLGEGGDVYAMMMEVSLPEGVDPDELSGQISAAVPDVEVSVHPLDVETF